MLLQICVFWFIWRINVDRLFYKLIFFIFYLVLVVLGVCYCTGFSLVEASGGCSLAVLCRRLIVVTCLVGHRLSGAPALVVTPCRLSSYDHGLSWPVACGIFPNRGANLRLLHWQVDSLPLHHQGSPYKLIFKLAAAVAATAKSLQSCLTLCDPIDGSPPGSPVPRILQARILEWVAISFSIFF